MIQCSGALVLSPVPPPACCMSVIPSVCASVSSSAKEAVIVAHCLVQRQGGFEDGMTCLMGDKEVFQPPE